jgi:hypothetical protein
MTAEEFLQQLNPNSRVFDLSIDYKYTEEQLVLFAKLYHKSELKKMRVTDVSGLSEHLVSFLRWYVLDESKRSEPDNINNVVSRYLNETNCH